MDIKKLAEQIIAGKRLKRGDDLSFLLSADLDELREGADMIRSALCGDKVDLCTIISGREGNCGENCRFCAQSAISHAGCDRHEFLDPDIIFERAKSNQEEGVDRFGIVDSGYGPSPADFEKIIAVVERMHRELKIELCCSLGFMTAEQFHRLHVAGVTGIHNNIETSRRFFPHICTSHTFDDKIANIRRAQAEELAVCSGGIIGMGENWDDRIDMALTLSELSIHSIPINSLMPIKGTPLEELERISEDDILRTIAIFRFINPDADIRLAGGRIMMKDNGRSTFSSGASASITGNMLTTSGSTIAQDLAMLKELGRDTTPDWERPADKRWDRNFIWKGQEEKQKAI